MGEGVLDLEVNICNAQTNKLCKGVGHTLGRSPAPVKQELLEPFILFLEKLFN